MEQVVIMSDRIEQNFISVDLINLTCDQQQLDCVADDEVTIAIHGDVVIDGNAISGEQVLSVYRAAKEFSSFYQQLSGHFWLLAIDKKQQQVTLVNDQLGIEACYYAVEGDTLLVSSSLRELKVKASEPFTLSNQAIFNYIYFHCIPSPTTIYTQAAKLEPSKAILFKRFREIEPSLISA